MRIKSHEEALWKLPATRRFSFVNSKQGDDRAAPPKVISKEYDFLQDVKLAAAAVRAVVDTEEVVFNIRCCWISGIEVVEEFGRLAKQLTSAIKLDFAELQRLLPGHCFNPYVRLLVQALDRFVDLSTLLEIRKSLFGDEAKQLVHRLNEMVAFLRRESNGPEMLSLMDGWARRVRKRCQSAKRYVDRLFARHADLLVLRVDLAYGMEQMADPETWASPVNLQEANSDMAKFDRFARENYPVVGHMHCREYGLLSGYHFHVLYFLNRSVKQSEVHTARELGERWQNVITHGRGRYYNCNAQPYARRGIGKILHGDAVKREILLDSVVSYITKADFWLFHEDAGKSFVRGQMPPEPSGLGRPRRQPISPYDSARARTPHGRPDKS